MFDVTKAADYYVLGWCKNWSLRQYLNVVLEKTSVDGFVTPAEVDAAAAAFPWLPVAIWNYANNRLIRAHTDDNYPKLSAWLHGRRDDLARLACAPQLLKLRDRGRCKATRPGPRKDKKFKHAMDTARIVSDIQKSTQRGAWNVCKA